jgi:20S proteasome alpha/beta subunit
MTCVIGAKGADGSTIVADTRVMREFEATNESKFHILWNRAAIAGAGTTAILDKFAERLSKSAIPTVPDFQKVVDAVEDIAFDLRERYEPRIDKDYAFQALVMGLEGFDKGDPYVRLVHSQGMSEDVKDFAIIGHGAAYASSFFKLLYDPMLTAAELGVLGYFSISLIVDLGLDQTVGVSPLGPEVVILRTNEEPAFLSPTDSKFSMARTSLGSLRFRYKLVKQIWENLPQAFENMPSDLF